MAGSSELYAGAPMQVELAEVDIHGVLAMLDSDDPLAQDPALSPDALGSCWGVYLKCSGVGCTPGFRQGKGHFKNKFCSRCQTQPLPVPLDRVRALDPAQASTSNRRSEGFWNESDEGCFRVVNNTAACIEPPIAIYREAAPVETRAEWKPVPEQWIEEGCVKFCVAKGTLVPVASLRGGHLYSSQQQKRQRTAATAEVEGADLGAGRSVFDMLAPGLEEGSWTSDDGSFYQQGSSPRGGGGLGGGSCSSDTGLASGTSSPLVPMPGVRPLAAASAHAVALPPPPSQLIPALREEYERIGQLLGALLQARGEELSREQRFFLQAQQQHCGDSSQALSHFDDATPEAIERYTRRYAARGAARSPLPEADAGATDADMTEGMIAEPYGSNRRSEAGEPSRAAGRDRASTDPQERVHRAQTHAGMEASERTPTRHSTRRFFMRRGNSDSSLTNHVTNQEKRVHALRAAFRRMFKTDASRPPSASEASRRSNSWGNELRGSWGRGHTPWGGGKGGGRARPGAGAGGGGGKGSGGRAAGGGSAFWRTWRASDSRSSVPAASAPPTP